MSNDTANVYLTTRTLRGWPMSLYLADSRHVIMNNIIPSCRMRSPEIDSIFTIYAVGIITFSGELNGINVFAVFEKSFSFVVDRTEQILIVKRKFKTNFTNHKYIFTNVKTFW